MKIGIIENLGLRLNISDDLAKKIRVMEQLSFDGLASLVGNEQAEEEAMRDSFDPRAPLSKGIGVKIMDAILNPEAHEEFTKINDIADRYYNDVNKQLADLLRAQHKIDVDLTKKEFNFMVISPAENDEIAFRADLEDIVLFDEQIENGEV